MNHNKNQNLSQVFLNFSYKAPYLITSLLCLSLLSCAPSSTNETFSNPDHNSHEQSQIINGQLATSNFQQDHGIVQIKIIGQFGDVATCTGSLIDRDIVLTAAHCLADPTTSQVVVLFGLTDINLDRSLMIPAVRGVIHENFNNQMDPHTEVWNDIALLKLNSAAPENFKLAQLPPIVKASNLQIGSQLTLAGYGITNSVIRKVVKDKRGRQRLVELQGQGAGTLRVIDQINVVAITANESEITLDQTQNKGACHGDSGGPAFIKQNNGALVLVGVTSRGTESLGNCNEKSVYTGVAFHLNWIQQNIQKLHAPSTPALAKR